MKSSDDQLWTCEVFEKGQSTELRKSAQITVLPKAIQSEPKAETISARTGDVKVTVDYNSNNLLLTS